MDIIVVLIPIALAMGLIGLVAFFWSMKTGQFDDLDGAALRALRNDDGSLPDRNPTQGEKNRRGGQSTTEK